MRNNTGMYKKPKVQSAQRSINSLLILMILGSLVGGIFMYYSRIGDYQSINNIIQTKDLEMVDYIEIILKNAKYLIVIWLLGFVSIGGYFIYLLTFIKGFSFGFTTAILFYMLQMEGIKYAIFTYVPQSFLYIPFYIFICMKAIQNINQNRERGNNKIDNYRTLYIIILFSIIISMLDLLLLRIF